MPVYLYFVLLICYMTAEYNAQDQDCSILGDVIGSTESWDNVDTGQESYIQYLSHGHKVDCHGIVTEWEFAIRNNSNQCNDMIMQVWRPDAGDPNMYTLAAQHYVPMTKYVQCSYKFTTDVFTTESLTTDPVFTSQQETTPIATMTTFEDPTLITTDETGSGEGSGDLTDFITFTTDEEDFTTFAVFTTESEEVFENVTIKISIPLGTQIQVQEGDIIGWVDINLETGTSRVLPYAAGLAGSNLYDRILIRSTECSGLGGQCSWDDGSPDVVLKMRRYSLSANLTQPKPPALTNLPATITIDEHGSVFPLDIYKVHAENNRMWEPGSVPPSLKYVLINGGDGKFVIDESTAEVTNIAEIDFESNTTLPIEISVYDGPVTFAAGILNILVTDINEPHTIDPPDNDRRVLDLTTTLPDPILTLEYTDPDDINGYNDNWPNKIWFIASQDPNTRALFSITTTNDPNMPSKGELVAPDLTEDWVGPDNMVLDVYCTDGTYLAGPQSLEFIIINMREPPRLTNLPKSTAETLSEGLYNRHNIFKVTSAVDDRSATTQYRITRVYPDLRKNLFLINNNDNDNKGNIRTGNFDYHFDYMKQRHYEIEIVVEDDLFTSDPANLTVEITPVNQKPEFPNQPKAWTSTIKELEPIDTELHMVILDATDRDLPLGDWIYYTITSENGGEHLFRADNITNRVYVDQEILLPDGVGSYTYDLRVHVWDSTSAHDTAYLSVTVIGQNLHRPLFERDHYTGNILETAQGGTSIATLTAMDNDGGNNGYLDFYIQEEPARSYFEVVRMDGKTNAELRNIQNFKYYDQSSFTFTVMAADRGYPISYNDTTTVTVHIEDVNTERPEFPDDFYNLEIPTSVGVGYKVVTLLASDGDSEAVSTITYSLVVPEDDFRLGATSGIVTVQTAHLPPYQEYVLYVYATDNGVPKYYSDPCIVRIDTYKAGDHLVDIHLKLSLEEFTEVQEEFMEDLHWILYPRLVRIENIQGNTDKTIITIYAIRDDTTETKKDIGNQKKFEHRNAILSILSSGVQGHPTDILLGPDFAKYKVSKVVPTHPVWPVETVEGIVTLTFLLLIAVVAAAALAIYCAKQKAVLCFKRSKRTWVAPEPEPPKTEEFDLSYNTKKEVPPIFTVAYNKPSLEQKSQEEPDMFDFKIKPNEERYTKPMNPGYKPSMNYPRGISDM